MSAGTPDPNSTGSVAAQYDDAALHWNTVALDAIRATGTAPPDASRALAVESIAVHDAVAAAVHATPFAVAVDASGDLDADLAAAAAAVAALEGLFPALTATFEAELARYASAPQAASAAESIELGRRVGAGAVARYADDGWDEAVAAGDASAEPGVWRPTAPAYLPALDEQWATLRPFAMRSPDACRPSGPPALGSAAYQAAVEEVRDLGSATSTARTAEQTEIAYFWADGSGTYTPPGHWNAIAGQIAAQRGDGLLADATMFAALNVALADAAIAAWDAKFHFDLWRPVTAIREAGAVACGGVAADPDWTPLLATPPFPSYVSGHSTFSAAAAAVLDSVYGAGVSFDTTSLGLPGAVRHFDNFDAAAIEAGRSRIYGGIHYGFDDRDGQAVRREVAAAALKALPPATAVEGTEGDDRLVPGGGDSVLNGRGGRDWVDLTAQGHRGDTVHALPDGGVALAHGGHADALRGVEEVRFLDGRLVFDAADPAAQVHRLYHAALGRAPDQQGLDFWVAKLDAGMPLKAVAGAFLASAEFSARSGAAEGSSDAAFVERLYQDVLHRNPDPGGAASWTGALSAHGLDRADMLLGFSESAEGKAALAAETAKGIWVPDGTAAAVARLYDAVLGRLPDAGGLSAWKTQVDLGAATLKDVAAGFVASAEFQEAHGGLDDAHFVDALYADALHRGADQAGHDHWTGLLAQHALDRADVALAFSESAEHTADTASSIMGTGPQGYGILFA